MKPPRPTKEELQTENEKLKAQVSELQKTEKYYLENLSKVLNSPRVCETSVCDSYVTPNVYVARNILYSWAEVFAEIGKLISQSRIPEIEKELSKERNENVALHERIEKLSSPSK